MQDEAPKARTEMAELGSNVQEVVHPNAGPSAASPAPSSSSSSGRPHYVPQFSAATQMILKRINAKPGSLSSALSSAASSMAGNIEKAAYEDAKRRVLMNMNMNTSLTMPMPAPKKPAASTIITASLPQTMPINDAFQLRTPVPMQVSSMSTPPNKPGALKPSSAKMSGQKAKAKGTPRGTKRKRNKDEEEDSASLSELSETEADKAQAQAVLTMTKSGRQVQKPTQYNPSQPQGSKRKHYGKRTPEQALCKVCTRGLSPANNQIVFCDGCNVCWHQLCHDPYIDDDFVSNESRSWFCSRCLAKREKHLAKKKSLDGFRGISWATKSAEQKRSYLSSVSHAQLVNIVMYSVELHPDLPVFPTNDQLALKRGPQKASAGPASQSLTSKAVNAGNGPAQFVAASSTVTPKPSTPDSLSRNGQQSQQQPNGNKPKIENPEAQEQAERESSVESILPAWPRSIKQGCLAGLEMNEDDLQDKDDYEAFSVTTYDAKGYKILENGVPV